jgi:hypothetical protein
MKKIFYVIVALLFIQYSSAAQLANSSIRELGINLSGSTFGIRYKTGNENTLFRLTLLSLSGSSSNYKSPTNNESRSNSQGLGFNFGFEKRKLVSDGLNIYFGSDILTSYQRNTYKNNYSSISQSSTDLSLSPGLGLVLGFNYEISSKINISAEVMPSISYVYTKSTSNNDGTITKNTRTGLDYGLRTSGVNLTLSFNIGK